VALYINIFGAIYFVPALVGIDLSVGANSWFLLIVLGVLNTAVATSLYLRGLDIVKVQKAVVLNYLEPASAVMFGYLFLSQPATPGMILGGSLILVAGYVVTTKR
jgi:drug/metabolite transporter (DMT)-like permease